ATIHTAYKDDTAVSSICLWDLSTGAYRVLEGRPNNNRLFTNTAFAPDAATLAAVSSDGSVRLWEVGSGKPIRQMEGGSALAPALTFSPSGALLALAVSETAPRAAEAVVVFDVASGKKVGRFLTARRAANLAFSGDGKKLAAADSPVRVWDIDTGKV